jgi:hypothetical protein
VTKNQLTKIKKVHSWCVYIEERRKKGGAFFFSLLILRKNNNRIKINMQRREKMLTVNNFISLLIKMSKIKIEKKINQ